MQTRIARIFKELVHHFPYAAVGVAACLGILLGIEKAGWRPAGTTSFHIFHPIHLFLSGAVTTAMFYEYEKRHFKTVAVKAMVVGFFSTFPICSLSDVFIPYLGGLLWKTPVQFHLCAIEEPWLVFPASFAGIIFGVLFLRWVEKGTEIFHPFHVLVSSLASLLYLASFDVALWQESAVVPFIITLIAVWVSCCFSDIIFPLWFVGMKAPCCGHHPHDY